MPVSVRLIGTGVAALGVIFVVLSLFVIPDWPPIADLVTSDSEYNKVIDNGVGFSWYIVLVLGLVVVALSFLRFQQTGGALPGPRRCRRRAGRRRLPTADPAVPAAGCGHAGPAAAAVPAAGPPPPQGPPQAVRAAAAAGLPPAAPVTAPGTTRPDGWPGPGSAPRAPAPARLRQYPVPRLPAWGRGQGRRGSGGTGAAQRRPQTDPDRRRPFPVARRGVDGPGRRDRVRHAGDRGRRGLLAAGVRDDRPHQLRDPRRDCSTFLAAVHGGITVDGVSAAWLPLGMLLIVAVIAWRAGSGLADAADDADESDPGRLALAGLAQVLSFTVGCLVAVPFATLGTSRAPFLGVGVGAIVLFSRDRRRRVRARERAARVGGRASARPGGAGAASRRRVPRWSTSAAAALLAAVSLVLHHAQAERLSTLGRAAGSAAIPVLLLGVLAAPNVAIAAAAYLAGPGFALGTGTHVSALRRGARHAARVPGARGGADRRAQPGRLDSRRAHPAGSPGRRGRAARPARRWLVGALRVGRGGRARRRRRDARCSGGRAAVSVGDGRLHTVGASPWQLGGAVAAAVAGIATLSLGPRRRLAGTAAPPRGRGARTRSSRRCASLASPRSSASRPDERRDRRRRRGRGPGRIGFAACLRGSSSSRREAAPPCRPILDDARAAAARRRRRARIVPDCPAIDRAVAAGVDYLRRRARRLSPTATPGTTRSPKRSPTHDPTSSCSPASCASSTPRSSARFRIVNTHPALLPAFPGAHRGARRARRRRQDGRRHRALGRRGSRHRPGHRPGRRRPVSPATTSTPCAIGSRAAEKPLVRPGNPRADNGDCMTQDRRPPRADQRVRQVRARRAGPRPARGRRRDRVDRIDRSTHPRPRRAVTPVDEVTGFPEILGGRVKTLHPHVHAGLLADQNDPTHMQTIDELGIAPFQLLVSNLYPFADTVASGAAQPEIVEQIDIGGPAMVRASAKNHGSIAVVTDPSRYPDVLAAVAAGGFDLRARQALATGGVPAHRDLRHRGGVLAGQRACARRRGRRHAQRLPRLDRRELRARRRPALRREPAPAGRAVCRSGRRHAVSPMPSSCPAAR